MPAAPDAVMVGRARGSSREGLESQSTTAYSCTNRTSEPVYSLDQGDVVPPSCWRQNHRRRRARTTLVPTEPRGSPVRRNRDPPTAPLLVAFSVDHEVGSRPSRRARRPAWVSVSPPKSSTTYEVTRNEDGPQHRARPGARPGRSPSFRALRSTAGPQPPFDGRDSGRGFECVRARRGCGARWCRGSRRDGPARRGDPRCRCVSRRGDPVGRAWRRGRAAPGGR